MTPAEVAAILRQFNEWRRSDYEPSEQPAPPDPREISEAIDSAIEMIDRLEAAEKERDWHAERCEDAMNECDALRAKIEQMERQEPVAWRTYDGEGGYDYRNVADNENYKAEWDARNPNHKGWVEPLYALPGAKGE